MFILKFFLFWNDHTDGWVCKTACAPLECITRALSPAPEWNMSLWSFFFKVLCVAPSPNCIPFNHPRGNHPTGICVNHLLDLFSSFIIQDGSLKMGDQPQKLQFSSVQLLSHVNPLWLHGLQHTMPPCPSPTPGACSNSCPLSQWSHSTILSSVVPFSFCLQSFPASGSFPMSQFFASSVQSIGASASASVLPNEYSGLISYTTDWFDSSFLKLKWLKNVKITSSGYMKHGESKPWCAPQPSKGMESLYPLWHRGPLKTWCSVREAGHRRPHVVECHWYKVSRIGKSRETEHSSVVA